MGDVRPLTRLNITVIVEDGAKRESGSYGGGGRVALDFFLEDDRWQRFASEAVRQAVMKLGAVDAPAGDMTVVLGPGWPGILLHEAVGHGLEGDFNRKKTSAFSGRLGQPVASELVTVVDDGTIANRRGSLNVDDEGVPDARATCSSRRASCAATCRTGSTRGSWAWRSPATGDASRTRTRRCRA